MNNSTEIARVLLALFCCCGLVRSALGAALNRGLAETPPGGEVLTPLKAETSLELQDPRHHVDVFSPKFQDRDAEIENDIHGRSTVAEKLAVYAGLSEQRGLSASSIGSEDGLSLKRESKAFPQKPSKKLPQSKTNRRASSDMEKGYIRTDLSRPIEKLPGHINVMNNGKFPHHIDGGRETDSEDSESTAEDLISTTIEVLSTTQRTTSISMFEVYCAEACGQGVGGPECNCPDHPIG